MRQCEPLIGLLQAPASYSIGVGFPPYWYGLLLGLGLRPTRHPIPARSTLLARTQLIFIFSLAPKFFLIEQAQKSMQKIWKFFLGPNGWRYAVKSVLAHFCRSLEKFHLRVNLFTL